MENSNQKHWDRIYTTKQPNEVSWTQERPQTSLDFIYNFNLPKTAKIIDIGGGESKLVDHLLEEGYSDISVLDISSEALNKVKRRLGEKAKKVNWIVSDVTEFQPDRIYDIWHDRATFHFLVSSEQVQKYINIARQSIQGFLIVGTFSTNGPQKCSGLEIKQYNEDQLSREFAKGFDKIRCVTEDHITPFNTKQNFLFCSFKRQK